MSSKGDVENFWFFLSYARRDMIARGGKVDTNFTRFYEDLALEIGRVKGLPTSLRTKDISFYDRQNINAGAKWDPTLMRALQSSRVLLCLLSASYITRPYCGKEFQAFSDRVKLHEETLGPDGLRPEVIIPILWDIPHRYTSTLPDALKQLQFDHASFGEWYAQEGVIGLLRRRRTAAYSTFIERLAERIAAVADRKLPRLSEALLSKIQSAWEMPETSQAGEILSLATGYKTVWFIYTAGGQNDYERVRSHRACYGRSGREWKPYLPPADVAVNDIASEIAGRLGVTAKAVNLSELPSEKFLEQLREADDSNTMIIIVVDPWSVQISATAGPLKEYDGVRLINSGVVILWNDEDEETRLKWQELEEKLSTVFESNLVTADVTFQPYIHSIDELRANLTRAIEEVKQRIDRRGKGMRGRNTPQGDTLPHLSAVGGTPSTPVASPGGVA
jgi:FxsC-like protein